MDDGSVLLSRFCPFVAHWAVAARAKGPGLQQLTELETGAGPGPDWWADPRRELRLLDFRLGLVGQRLVAFRPIGRGLREARETRSGVRGRVREVSVTGLHVEMRLSSVVARGWYFCCAG
jgi:hypothetical protein